MKRIFFLLSIVMTIFQACEKSESTYRPLTSYTVVNATADQPSIKVYAADHEISWSTLPNSDAVPINSSGNFGAYAGENIIRAVSGTDTLKTIFSPVKSETFHPATFNTLFLVGDSTTAYDAVLLTNETMANYSDSIMGIRFINLSPNSHNINITLSNTSWSHEVTGLAYKEKTHFLNYPALSSTGDMVFELRNDADEVLATYTFNAIPHTRFKNITLVIKGTIGITDGDNAFGIFPVPHY